MRSISSIVAAAIVLFAMACARESTEVSCPRPENPTQLLVNTQIATLFGPKGDTGIYFFGVPPDSFWACAGIAEGDLIVGFDSRPLSEAPALLELMDRIIQGAAVELSVQDDSGSRRSIIVR